MKILTTEEVNFQLSKESIEATIKNLRNNYDIHKSRPVEKYYCRAIIEHDFFNIEKRTCTVSLLDTETEAFFFSKEHTLSFLPLELLKKAKNMPLINVLVCLKLFYYSTFDTIEKEMTLIVPIGETIGCPDNDIFITEDVKETLTYFYKKRRRAWMNGLAHPSYKDLQDLEQKMLVIVKRLMSA